MECNFYTGDIQPEEGVVFVFGSDPEGRHVRGAAKLARDSFGAIKGIGYGLVGNSYALVTRDLRIKGSRSVSKAQIIENIKVLYEVANSNPSKVFKVAYRNTYTRSLNGYTGREMFEMFCKAGDIPSNVLISEEWHKAFVLGSNIKIEPSDRQVITYSSTNRSHNSPYWGQTVVTDKYVYFYQGVQLSNWSTSRSGIPFDGYLFKSSESIYMYLKAKCFKDHETARKIANSGYYEAKRLGAMVKNFDTTKWFKHSFKAMYKALELKFYYDEEFREVLMDERYRGKEFVEAAKVDNIWGIGSYATEEVIKNGPKAWHGFNRLGKALTILRDEMLGDSSKTELTLISPYRLPGKVSDLFPYEERCVKGLRFRLKLARLFRKNRFARY